MFIKAMVDKSSCECSSPKIENIFSHLASAVKYTIFLPFL